MKASVEFAAEARKEIGTGSARAARRAGKTPVSVYAKGKENLSLAVETRLLSNEYFRGGFMNKVIALTLDGKNIFAIPRDIQLNPVTDQIEHADFLAVDEKSIVKVRVPVHFLNTEKSVGIKRGGVLNIVAHDLELLAPVGAIPKAIEIDIATLDIGSSVHTSTITFPQGVSSAVKSRDVTIASIAGRSKEEEVDAAAPTTAAVPSIKSAAADAAAAAAPAAGAKPAAKK